MRSVLFALTLIGVLLATADARKCYSCDDGDDSKSNCAYPKINKCKPRIRYCEWVSLDGQLSAGCTGTGNESKDLPTGCNDSGPMHACVCNEDVRFNFLAKDRHYASLSYLQLCNYPGKELGNAIATAGLPPVPPLVELFRRKQH